MAVNFRAQQAANKRKTFMLLALFGALTWLVLFAALTYFGQSTSSIIPIAVGISLISVWGSKIFWDYEGSPCMAVFEKLGPIFGSSKKTTWSMGVQVGLIKTICTVRAIPYTEVPAKSWQKEMFQGIPAIHKSGKSSLDTKAMAQEAMKRLYPTVNFKRPRAAKQHDGLIDALLIAGYGKRKNL